MDLITKRAELEANLKRLEEYRYSSDPAEQDFYRDLVKLGICFVVLNKDGKLLWGPSRFVGYRNNSVALHIRNDEKDGRETNPAITVILRHPPEQDEHLEASYSEHCKDLGFTASPTGAFGIKRKYWLVSM
jgi:putative restriction endonuclease